MAKNEKRTLKVILDELEAAVKSCNELDMANVERVALKKQAEDLAKEYNELSMLTVYANCLEDKLPVKAFVEAGTYKTKRIKRNEVKEPDKEGCLHLVISYSVDDGAGDLDITKFLEWAASKNKQAAHSADWRDKMAAVKDAIKDSYSKSLNSKGDTHKISVKALKGLVQDMFDALIFIPTEKGENAVIADGYIAKLFREFATQTNTKLADSDNIGSVLTGKVWNTLVMKGTKSAVKGKKLTVDFDGVESAAKSEDETSDETTAE